MKASIRKTNSRAPLRRLAVVATIIATALIALPAQASAQTGNENLKWTCRASMAYVLIPGLDRIEPLMANGSISAANPNRPRCMDDENATPTIALNANPLLNLVTSNAVAVTAVDPDTLTPGTQSAAAATYTDTTRLGLIGNGVVLDLGVTRSFAVGTCGPNKTTILTGGSELAGVRLNGQNIPVDDLAEALSVALNGLVGSVIRIDVNERVKTGGSGSSEEELIHRALNIQVLGLQAVLGESKVGRVGAICDANALDRECPAGSEFDRLSGYCLKTVRIPGSNGKCPLGATKLDDGGCAYIFAVGPGDPTGGTIVPIDQVPGGRTSPCRNKKFGRSKLAVVGTNKRDKINGSTGRDRIFSFGGKDSVGAGRGDDCVDAGTASDVVDGDTGADLLLGKSSRDILNGGGGKDKVEGSGGHDSINGGSGRDHLKGGSGRDKIVGGSGNDLIRGGPERDYLDDGQGRDRVYGDSGGDFINVGIASKPSRINCGSGSDRARVNTNERFRAKRCEVLKVLP